MPTPEDRPEVEIDADVAVWLRGPAIDATDDVREKWIAGAVYAVATDFGLEDAKGGADYREYVARVLGSFARWKTPANITFLRFRYQGDTPIPVGIELYNAADVEEVVAAYPPKNASQPASKAFLEAMLTVDEDVPTVGEISRELVEGSAWERLIYWVEDPEDGVTSRLRFVRRYTQTGTVVIARFGGISPALTVEAIPDVDDLVRGIRIGGES